MAVSETSPKISYTADGSVGATYSIPFEVLDATHLDMYADGTKVTGGKTVNGAGTGTVTVNTDTDYANGVVLLFKLNVPYEQQTVFPEDGQLSSKELQDSGNTVCCS